MAAQEDNTASVEPLISIIVPSFNLGAYLPQALDSILQQDYPHIEVFVADGGSEDDTVAVLERYAQRDPRLAWLSEPDDGPADAVNKGLARVSGEIIGVQSADDVYYRGAFRAVAQAFSEHPQCGMVYGDLDGVDATDTVLYTRRFPEFSWKALFAMSLSIGQSSVFFRRSAARAVGQWDGRYYGCDLDYWLRLGFHAGAVHVPQVLSGWRRLPEQRTRPDQFKRIWDDYWHMIEDSPAVAAAPAGVRRLAHASKHLLVLRTPPSASYLTGWRHLLLGAVLHPGFWRYNPARLILGQIPGFRALQRINRWRRERFGHAKQKPKAAVPQSSELSS